MESALAFLQLYHDDGDEFKDWIITNDETWVADITSETKLAVNALASQWISLQDEIQADYVGAKSNVHGVLEQMGHSPHRLPDQRFLSVTVKHCRNCDGPFRTNSEGCLVPHDNARLDGQYISYRSSAGRCLIILPIARTSRPVIFIFSYTSRNSCRLAPTFSKWQAEMSVTQRFQSQAGNTFTTQGYESWSHGMTNVSILEVSVFKKLLDPCCICSKNIFPLNWVLFLQTAM